MEHSGLCDDVVRLNKYLSSAGVASRRKCDELIKNGEVYVNGKNTELIGMDITPNDVVTLHGKRVNICEDKKYYLLNKPQGYICSSNDEKNRRSVLELVPNDTRLFTVGRLDYNTEGLIIITNDGELTNKLTHPKHGVFKEYYVEVEGKIDQKHIETLKNGVELDDGTLTGRAKVKLVKSGAVSRIYVTIGEGKNRQIRRMFESLGYRVLYLCRTKIGEIKLENIELGQYRELTEEELDQITNHNAQSTND